MRSSLAQQPKDILQRKAVGMQNLMDYKGNCPCIIYIFLQYITLCNVSGFQLSDPSSIPAYMENFRENKKKLSKESE